MSIAFKHVDHYKRLVSLCNDVAELREKLATYTELCEVSDTFYCETSYLDEDQPLTVIHKELLDAVVAIEDGMYDDVDA